LSERRLRAAERAWLSSSEDPALLKRFLGELVRAGEDPVLGLVAAAPKAPWAGLLAASVPIVHQETHRVGRGLFGLIRNGTYFHTRIDVFGPDSIDAWGKTSREGLPEVNPRLVTEGAVGGAFSVHNLGGGEILEGEWSLSDADFLRGVDLVLAALAAQPKVEVPSTLKSGRPWGTVPYRSEGDTFLLGGSIPVLTREGDRIALRPWLIYSDGSSQLGPGADLVDLETSIAALEEGAALLRLPPDSWLEIPGLGRARLVGRRTRAWFVDAHERVKEARDELAGLKGRDTAHQLALDALQSYRAVEREQGPGEALNQARRALRVAYTDVPEHLRLYLGDMDSKDSEYRAILQHWPPLGRGS
jgi:hypothetical protein